MTGDWAFARVDDPPPKHERVRLVCDNGVRVSLVDSRALAVMRLHAPGALRLPPLGPEPLDPAFTGAALQRALIGKSGPVKPTLLNQRVVAGLGNIYAAESLWEAGISPAAPASSLSSARCERLAAAIRLVLERAPVERYYERNTPDSINVSAASPVIGPWRVYDREGLACVKCGATIKRLSQAGRSTCYCPRCQRR
jgi:formamidopyrimidine-DNA glycosylase